MAIEFIWQLPTGGDGRYGNAQKKRRGERNPSGHTVFSAGVSDPRGDRFNYLDHLHQIARGADLAGFDGIKINNDPEGDESWIVAGYVARGTRHVKLLTEFDASRGSAVYAAKNAVSYQRFTNGRFAWQISSGGDAAQRRRQGDFAADSDVAPRIEEFVTVARGVLSSAPYSFKGKHFEVLDGGFRGPLGNKPLPPVYLSGNSEDAYALSARVADVHVFDALPLEALKPEIGKLRALAAAQSRSVRLGLRIDLLARESEEEAVSDARRQVQQSTGKDISAGTPASAGFWPGFASALTGAQGVLVGSHEQVSARLAEYADAGIESFILGAVPHFEEAYRTGEHILPAVRRLTSTSGRNAA